MIEETVERQLEKSQQAEKLLREYIDAIISVYTEESNHRFRYKQALETIRNRYGAVCAEFETCDHAPCRDSYNAWQDADAALREVGEKTVPEGDEFELYPQTLGELIVLLNQLTQPKEPTDEGYQQAADALWKAAYAAFNYVAESEGVTGFMAAYAIGQFVREARSIEGPFMLVQAMDMLFPQYDTKIDDALNLWRQGWAKEEARRRLEAMDEEAKGYIHPDVLERWQELAGKEDA